VLLADVIVASDTTVFSDYPHLTFGIAPGDGLFVVWEEVLGLNRARQLEIRSGSFTAQRCLVEGEDRATADEQRGDRGRNTLRSAGEAARPRRLVRQLSPVRSDRLSPRRVNRSSLAGNG
jgi:enoyl-CoA hydratase/carnithine racemase